MLTSIHIKNLTIIEELSLDLTSGLTVITGETGAGKSIWVDAVQLALGSRADSNLIRTGAERGEITLCFNVAAIAAAQEWLVEQDLDEETPECIIRRVIDRNSRSRCSINGRPVSVSQLCEFSQYVLAIHSQHQQQTLLREDGQQYQVDQYAELWPYLQQTKELFSQWQQFEHEKISLEQQIANKETELEWLEYQLTEIKDLALINQEEWHQLTLQHQQLSRSEQLVQVIQNALLILSENDRKTATSLLQQAQHDLSSLSQYKNLLAPVHELLIQADIYLHEAISELKNLQSHVEISPEKLHLIEQRLNKMHHLARKHQVPPESLWQVEAHLSEKILKLKQADELIKDLQNQQTKILQEYHKISGELTAKRVTAAALISQKVSESMQHLGMTGGRFNVKLIPRQTHIHPQGQEKMIFVVTTNPGQDAQPLQKMVSGGELSRIHLALQVLIAKQSQTPTLIFDEIDVGIGGRTAAIVGKLLRQLSDQTQVICITHQPQVAAFGQQHYQVSKQSQGLHTFSQIKVLNQKERIEELARMLGGTKITAHTRAHAEELLTSQ